MTSIISQIYIEQTMHPTTVNVKIIIFVIMHVVSFKYTTESFLASSRIRRIF